MRTLLLATALTLFAAGTLHPAAKKSTDIEKFKNYRSWYCDTPHALNMDAQFAVLCMPPSLPMDPIDPHEQFLFKIWVNPIGKAVLVSKKNIPFPVGAIVVKEKFKRPGTPTDQNAWRQLPNDAKPILLTAMVKREPGYDRPNGDWEYLVLDGKVTKETTTGLQNCAPCHQEQKSRDFIFRRHAGAGPQEHYIGIHAKNLTRPKSR